LSLLLLPPLPLPAAANSRCQNLNEFYQQFSSQIRLTYIDAAAFVAAGCCKHKMSEFK